VNSTIEHNGESVTLCNGYPHKRAGFVGVGETVNVCAYCDESERVSGLLRINGFKVSHGMCKSESCMRKFLGINK